MKAVVMAMAALGCFKLPAALSQEQAVLQAAGSTMNVVIIGAGAGGASSAYYLSKFAAKADVPVNITIFERNSYIGGRSITVNAYNDPKFPVELGASIFVEANSILVNATKEFNLSTAAFVSETDIPGAGLAVWDGEKIILTQNGSMGWWDIAKLLYKYGLAPVKTSRLVKSVVGKFLKMYEEPVFPFDSLNQAAQDVGLLAVTAATGTQYMEENGITGDFGHDVVQASTRVNYAQNLQYIHGLEAMVSMAAENAQSIEGGNWQIFDQMIAAAGGTTLLERAVTAIDKKSDGSYELMYDNLSGDYQNLVMSQNFDVVILAGPHQFSNISISPKDEQLATPDKIPYVQLHVTLFTSPHLLSPEFFGLEPGQSAPRVVLTTLPKTEQPGDGVKSVGSPGFYSISLLQAVKNPKMNASEYLYKIFSASPPSSSFLARLLGVKPPDSGLAIEVSDEDVTWIYRKVWNSYPYEYPRVTFEKIELDDNLWYTSGMDSFISTMETNALMGMNVARLIVDRWVNTSSQLQN